MNPSFIAHYGNPDADGDGVLDPEWFAANIRVFVLPFSMRLSWKPAQSVQRFQAHRNAGERIIAALKSVGAYKGVDYLRGEGLDVWGGCFNFRLVRGGRTLSIHSWGAAVDINPQIGALGSNEDALSYPRFIVEAFENEGFRWGGRFPRPDAMHFELID